MAPKQPTKARKSPTKPKDTKESSDLKRQILFLWTCHKVSDVHIDFPAVAKHFGIKNNAAMMRFKRLKKKLDAMEASIKSDDQDQDKDDDQEKTQINKVNIEDEDYSMDEIPPDSE
ncbi:hypothetical protein N7517_006491 [Penicillium concentricum]|uniref:Myb-like DNA-binding domain-containing protein n=1 Tax=Penicillium concentricum TaxID=293559 RepID=A0A9W9VCH7_9EURO|nr:uncharacterized protein N7517_006491 [Penicillium concentricum]KAJ5374485.1 hypothetical protein N7517_006491 [Penicillium concentricum]